MRRPTRDGTTRRALDPVDFLRRAVSLVPPARFHLTPYQGGLPSHSYGSSPPPSQGVTAAAAHIGRVRSTKWARCAPSK